MSGAIKKLIPLFDRVLIEKAEPLKKTVGGIVLPDSAAQKLNWGTVVEIGQGKKNSDGKWIPISSVKKGDTVMLGEWSGNKVKINDKELLIVNEEDILGIVEMEKK